MFKKTLVALAITSAAFGANAATNVKVDVDATSKAVGALVSGKSTVQISAEGVVGSASINFAKQGLMVDIEETTDSGMGTLAYVQIELTGGTFHPSAAPTFTFFDETTSADTSVDVDSTTYVNGGTVRLALDDAARAAIATQIGATTSKNANDFGFGITGIAINNTLSAGDKVSAKVSFVSNVGASLMHSASVDYATVAKQFSTSVTASTEKVSVGDARKKFVGTTAADQVTTTFNVSTVSGVADLYKATTTGTQKVTSSIVGDFSFLDSDGDNKVDTGNVGTGYVKGGQSLAASTDVDLSGASVQTNSDTYTVTVDKTRVIPTQYFTYTAGITYNNASLTAATYSASGAAGSWTLDGSTDTLAFMPFGDAYSQSITVTNNGTVEGAISVEFQFEGTTSIVDLGMTAAANAITDISAKVRAAAADKGIEGNARIRVIIDSPESQIVTTGLYYSKADGDRVLIPTL